ncbi:MAG: bifunctional tetrahydrofolate synthase/dihydrofolate synthase [Nitrosomonas sp.]|nr:bifunctional tetrahydrofolate synthase/dihydrofolate synthase [Nitrosomonas sp.]
MLNDKLDSLSDWLIYLEQLHPKTIEMGLERIEYVRADMKLSPDFPVIAVGGTNGKGSVCVMLESILIAAGYHVGCYTSPHLVNYNERIRINGRTIDDQSITEAFDRIDQSRSRCGISLTYFEFGTLAAMHLFALRQVDVAILEVGLGGRLDAVNVFEPDCAVLTNVALDHMDYLGDSREAIGYEKAGIFRTNKPAICSDANTPITVLQYAQVIGAQLIQLNQDFGFNADEDHWDFWSRKGKRSTLPLPALRGANQLINASACLAALDALSDHLPVSMQSIRQGLINATLRGRFQVWPTQPMVILDVAHNPAAAAVFAANLKLAKRGNTDGKTFAVFAMLHDKDISGVIKALKDDIDIWLIAPIQLPRGASVHELLLNLYKLGITRENHPIHEFDNAETAYIYACKQAAKNDRICVVGSFHTVGAVLQYLERKSCQ